MAAKAVVVLGPHSRPVTTFSAQINNDIIVTNNQDGYVLFDDLPAGPASLTILATDMLPAVHLVTLDGDSQTIRLGGTPVSPNDIILPALSFKQPLVNLHQWRGAFCIPDALIGSPYGDGRRIWTPSYGVYNDEWRETILDHYTARNYTHFVYNIASPDGVYHNDYPALADDPVRARRDLLEIRGAGLVAVVAACNDANGGTTTPYASVLYNSDLIPIIFPMWEMNGPLGVDTMIGGESVGRIGDCIRNTRAAAPHSLCYVHFTAGHGAGAEPEGEWWQWFNRQGGAGLLSQDDHWDAPAATAAGLTDTARHLHGHVGGWEGLNLDNVAFELQTTALYHYGRTEQQGLDYMSQVLNQANGIAGFCDSGRM